MKRRFNEAWLALAWVAGLSSKATGRLHRCRRASQVAGATVLLTLSNLLLSAVPTTHGAELSPAESQVYHPRVHDAEMAGVLAQPHDDWPVVVLLLIGFGFWMSRRWGWRGRRGYAHGWRSRGRRLRRERPWSEGWDDALARAREKAGFGGRTGLRGCSTKDTTPSPSRPDRTEAVPTLDELEARLARLNRRLSAMESEVTDGSHDWERRFREETKGEGAE